jgi:hypothetical protein
LHSSIRGLSPQAGGFRRRSITPASVNRVSGLAQVPIERLPCVQQVLTIHLLSISYSNTRQSFNPGYHSLFRGTRNIIPTLPIFAPLFRSCPTQVLLSNTTLKAIAVRCEHSIHHHSHFHAMRIEFALIFAPLFS